MQKDEGACHTHPDAGAVEIYTGGKQAKADFGSGDRRWLFCASYEYIHFLPDILRLLRTGGLLVSDNVLQDGDVLESRFAVTRRNRTIHARMREYLYELKHNRQLETVILPVGDGVTVSVKR